MSDTKAKELSGQSGTGNFPKKGKRYQGYDVEAVMKKRSGKRKPWFWKVLGISLLLTAAVLLSVCGYLFRSNQKMTAYISRINEGNTMDKLLQDHKNVTITTSYSHLSEGDDYKTTRFVKKTKKDMYYSYLKTEGMEKDYKEVIDKGELYRYDERFPYYFGLIGEDYENTCVSDIEGSVFQTSENKKIQSQKESGNFIKIESSCQVSDGDDYSKMYGFQNGDEITQVMTVDKETMIVMTAVESCNGEEFYSYTVAFDGENKVPLFYQDVKKRKKDRTCTVYQDYDEDSEKKYTFSIASDVYFTLLEHEDYKVYTDEDCEKEFNEFQLEVQNPEADLTFYLKKESE